MRLKYCLVDVLKVEVLNGYRLSLEFEDGRQGTVDISQLIPFEGIFEPLRDKRFFSRVTINRDTGTICWENGADLSPLYLYDHLQ